MSESLEILVERLIRLTDQKIESANEVIAKWRDESLALNPHYAFDWSDRCFTAAAELQLFSRFKHGLDHLAEQDSPDYAQYASKSLIALREEMIRLAKGASNNSTSPTRNLLEACTLSVTASILDEGFWGSGYGGLLQKMTTTSIGEIMDFTCQLIVQRGSTLTKTEHENMGEALFWLAEQSRLGFNYQIAECFWKGVRQFCVIID